MLVNTKDLIEKLEDYLKSNPELYFNDNEQLQLIVHSENKLVKKFIRYLESLG